MALNFIKKVFSFGRNKEAGGGGGVPSPGRSPVAKPKQHR